jgi:hypothetical protein
MLFRMSVTKQVHVKYFTEVNEIALVAHDNKKKCELIEWIKRNRE